MRSFMREKKIYCGPNFLEVDIFPYSEAQVQAAKNAGTHSKKQKESQPKQMKLNDKNARRYFTQLGNTNFGEGDYHVTLTYSNENLPQSPEEADKILKNFLDRVRYAHKRAGLAAVKYMLVTSYKSTKDGRPIRIHHHIIMSGGLGRDTIEDLWRKRKKKGQKKGDSIGYANVDRLQMGNGNGIAALCSYLAKQTGGKKRWSTSKGLDREKIDNPEIIDHVDTKQSRISTSNNLDSPVSRTNNHRYSHKEVERIAKNHPDYEYWERRYPGYELLRDDYGFEAVFNEYTGRWSVYAKLRRKQEGGTL